MSGYCFRPLGAVSLKPASRGKAVAIQSKSNSGGWPRRRILKSGLACVATTSAAAISGFPYVHAAGTVELRYISTGVNAYPQIVEKALRDLGIKLVHQIMTTDDILRMVITQPNSLDILELDYSILKQVFRLGRMQAISASKIDAESKPACSESSQAESSTAAKTSGWI